MKVYLLGRLLIQSQVYDDAIKENTRREGLFFNLERDWSIGLWNCGEKLTSGQDFLAGHEVPLKRMIGVTLEDYHFVDWEPSFRMKNITNPEKILSISGYHSFICTPRKKIMDLVRQLEKAEISCLVCHDGGIPLPHNYDYASKTIQDKIIRKFNVEKIEL